MIVCAKQYSLLACCKYTMGMGEKQGDMEQRVEDALHTLFHVTLFFYGIELLN